VSVQQGGQGGYIRVLWPGGPRRYCRGSARGPL